MTITVCDLIQALRQYPPDTEITLYVQGYEADSVSLFAGDVPVLEEEFGLSKLHFVTPSIKGETL